MIRRIFIGALAALLLIGMTPQQEYVLLLSGAPLFSAWNAADASAGVAITNGNKTATLTATSANGVRGTASKTSGKQYLEFTIGTTSADYSVGFANTTWPETNSNGLGGDNNSVAIYASGQIFLNNSAIATGTGFSSGHVVGMEVDYGAQSVGFRTDTGAFTTVSFAGINAGPYFPAFWDAVTGDSTTLNTGGTSFTGALPSGYSAWH